MRRQAADPAAPEDVQISALDMLIQRGQWLATDLMLLLQFIDGASPRGQVEVQLLLRQVLADGADPQLLYPADDPSRAALWSRPAMVAEFGAHYLLARGRIYGLRQRLAKPHMAAAAVMPRGMAATRTIAERRLPVSASCANPASTRARMRSTSCQLRAASWNSVMRQTLSGPIARGLLLASSGTTLGPQGGVGGQPENEIYAQRPVKVELDLPWESGEASTQNLGLIEVLMLRVNHGKVTAEFKRDALRILSTSGRTVAEVAADLGIGKSTLQRWRTEAPETDLLSGPHPDVEKEPARLRHENKILRQERDLLKNATAFFARETSR